MAEAKPKLGLIALTDMRDDPRNARTHDAAQVEQLANAIETYGFTNPPLIDRSADNLIVAGHGRKRAALLLVERGGTLRLPDGTALPAGKVPFIDVTGWPDEKRRAYALADNAIALNAGWDADILSAELEELAGLGFASEDLGFSDEMLDQLITDAGGTGATREPGALADSEFVYSDQYGIVVTCRDAKHQQEVFERLRDEGLEVKVVVV